MFYILTIFHNILIMFYYVCFQHLSIFCVQKCPSFFLTIFKIFKTKVCFHSWGLKSVIIDIYYYILHFDHFSQYIYYVLLCLFSTFVDIFVIIDIYYYVYVLTIFHNIFIMFYCVCFQHLSIFLFKIVRIFSKCSTFSKILRFFHSWGSKISHY